MAQATNINITGIGRYLADDWIYQFYQARWVYKNWFAQAYINTSLSGDTRNMRTGGIVTDHSKFFHLTKRPYLLSVYIYLPECN